MRFIFFIFLFLIFINCGLPAAPSLATNADDNTSPTNNECDTTPTEIININVGQGDATLFIESGCANKTRRAILFDGGRDFIDAQNISAILAVKNLELHTIIISHYDADHVGGISSGICPDEFGESFLLPTFGFIDLSTTNKETTVVENYFNCRDALLENFSLTHIAITDTGENVGYTLSLGEATLTIVAGAGYVSNNPVKIAEANEENENAMAALLSVPTSDATFYYLATSDLTGQQGHANLEDPLATALHQKNIKKIHGLGGGHHGSKSSFKSSFIDALQPSYVVISTGNTNNYGHVSCDTYTTLLPRDLKVLQTENGVTDYTTCDDEQILEGPFIANGSITTQIFSNGDYIIFSDGLTIPQHNSFKKTVELFCHVEDGCYF